MAAAAAEEQDARDWRSRVLEVNLGAAKVRAIYSRVAPVYEMWARLTEARPRRRVLELAGVRDRESVLEVASGTGAQLVELAHRNPSGATVGVELADGMLERTRRRLTGAGLERVVVIQASALDLPLRAEVFDVAVNSYMLDLLPRDDIPRALREFSRVLRPGGRLVLSNMTIGERWRHTLWDSLYVRGVNITANCRGVLAAPVLAELGFVDVERTYLAQMGFPTEIVTARKARPPADRSITASDPFT